MTKVPSSLLWLVRRRARILGLIEANERELARLTRISDRLTSLVRDLKALDRVIEQHDIPIDPSAIRPTRVYGDEKPRIKKWFKHGEFSRLLLASLRDSGEKGVTTKQLVQLTFAWVRERFPDERFDRYDEKRMIDLVRYRLKSMSRIGRVARVKPSNSSGLDGRFRRWNLPSP